MESFVKKKSVCYLAVMLLSGKILFFNLKSLKRWFLFEFLNFFKNKIALILMFGYFIISINAFKPVN